MKSSVFCGLLRLRRIALLTLCVHPLFGGVVLDGSFGTSGALPGPSYMISASFGKQVGGNLFQSFNQFNLISTESATFNGPNTVHNILARVTSGSPSSIDGTVNSSIQGANLFFLNPAGVMFGQNAQINVSGSFAVSTANYLKLADGGKFNTSLGGGDVLTSAPVSAFGFLSTASAPVSVIGSGLTVPQPFSIVSGDITITGGFISGSRVNLVSVKSSGEVKLDATSITSPVEVTQFTKMGAISMNSSFIAAGDFFTGGGSVTIRAGDVEITNFSDISAGRVTIQAGSGEITNFSGIFADSVAVDILGTLKIQGPRDSLTGIFNFQDLVIKAADLSILDGAGLGSSIVPGSLRLLVGTLTMRGPSFLEETAAGGGPVGGSIFIKATGNIDLQQAGISASAPAGASGGSIDIISGGTISLQDNSITASAGLNGGRVFIGAKRFYAVDNTISASTDDGVGGDVTIDVRGGDVTIIGPSTGEQLFAEPGIYTVTNGSGDAGNIIVLADSLLIEGPAGIFAQAFEGSNGKAGNISLQVRDITLRGEAVISSSTFGVGNGGNVTVIGDSLTMANGSGISSGTFSSGDGGSVSVTANSLLINGAGSDLFTSISVTAAQNSSGNAGSVTVHTNDLTIIGGDAGISAGTFGSGDAGDVIVTANSLLINGAGSDLFTGISATAEQGSSGNAGNLFVRSGDLRIVAGGQIFSGTFSSGDGGSVSVTANSLLINGTGPDLFTAISATAAQGSSGSAGSVTVHANDLTISGGNAGISASTFGSGDAGDVIVTANSLLINGAGPDLFTGVSATAEQSSSGKSGDVVVFANSLSLQNSGVISAASFTLATAGSVQLSLGTLGMNSGSLISSANFGNGSAGSVIIETSSSMKLAGGSSISTLADVGDAGSIDMISGGVIKLSAQSSITVSGGHNGGNIHITAPDLVYLLDSSITATAGVNGNGTGGNITIDPTFIVLNNSVISANAAAGQGGNINLISDFFFSSNSSVTATGTTNGTVNITAPELDLGAQLITLPISLLSAENQLQERCTALLQGDFSSFISIGRGGTEPEPDELQVDF